jgi:DNA-cytosine methyltransferase
MRHASLFSGIGGFDLAAQWMGWENVFQVEIDPFCQKVLAKNFPQVKRYGDIDEFNGEVYNGTIDVLSGGPPCQPASYAGKRKGSEDDRWKWPAAIRVCREIRPSLAVFENPDDLLTLDNGRSFEGICVSLEDIGYKIETYGIPAACVGAPHERDRIWIIADSNSFGLQEPSKQHTEINRIHQAVSNSFASYSSIGRLYRQGNYRDIRRGNGVPDRVDRLKCIGNAIVPQVAFEIFKAIEQVNNG